MQLEMPYIVPRTIIKKYEDEIEIAVADIAERIDSRWSKDEELFIFDTNRYDKAIVDEFLATADELMKDETLSSMFLKYKKKLQYVTRLTSSEKLGALKGMPLQINSYINKSGMLNSRFYMTYGHSEELQPFTLTTCKWHAADKYSPEQVSVNFKAILNNRVVDVSKTIHLKDAREAGTLGELFRRFGWYHENEQLNNDYNKQLAKYTELYGLTGEVYKGSGSCEMHTSDRWSRSSTFWFKDDAGAKVVIDNIGPAIDEASQNEKPSAVNKFVQGAFGTEQVELAILPYIWGFHLDEHCWLLIHVNQLERHKFAGKQLMDKLVLPETHKALIDLLMTSTKEDIADIIEGKKGGSFIMATGEPGTGKTLTAEVCSETIEKSLYKVQCSQLGLNVEQIEKNLSKVLKRATRWGSILLMDEADVYVRQRGSDIEQNAIVGVFLRNLEYYNGILFMTSNLESDIDDAILSRATAHIVYKNLVKTVLLKSIEFNHN